MKKTMTTNYFRAFYQMRKNPVKYYAQRLLDNLDNRIVKARSYRLSEYFWKLKMRKAK